MSAARVGFTANDADRQAGEAASGYFCRALRLIADRFDLEKSLERDPAAFAVQFAPLLSALIEAQAREYQSWVLYERLGEVADASRDALGDLANVISERLDSLDDSALSGLADIAEHIEEGNAGICRSCNTKAGRAYYEARRAAREAAGDGE